MSKDSTTAANRNKKIRQDNLREWLSRKCTAQHLVNNIEKIENLKVTSVTNKDGSVTSDLSEKTFELNKLKVANEQRLKVLNKYLSDLRNTDLEVTGQDGGPIDVKWTVEVIESASSADS